MDISPAAGHLTRRLAGGNGRTEQSELSLDVPINVKAAGRKASDAITPGWLHYKREVDAQDGGSVTVCAFASRGER